MTCSPAYLPVSTYMVITSWPKSGCATIWETDLTQPLTKTLCVSEILDGQFDKIARVMFADEQSDTFKDASTEIAEVLAAETSKRGRGSKAALDFCEIHGIPTPAYLKQVA